MKIIFLLLFLFSTPTNATDCALNGKHIDNLKLSGDFLVEYKVHVPLPPQIFELLEKYFGQFSRPECKNSITATKITNKKTMEYCLAFYTNESLCDGGNSYGVVFKGAEVSSNPLATIEDSYFNCL